MEEQNCKTEWKNVIEEQNCKTEWKNVIEEQNCKMEWKNGYRCSNGTHQKKEVSEKTHLKRSI